MRASSHVPGGGAVLHLFSPGRSMLGGREEGNEWCGGHSGIVGRVFGPTAKLTPTKQD